MRGFNGTLSSPVEARYRMSSSLNDETIKRKGLKSKNINGLKSFLQEKSAGCKFRSLKAILFIILFGSFLLLLYSPLSSENHLHQTSRIWDWRTEDSKYVSDADIEWSAISNAISNLDVSKSMNLSVGLMNFNSTEVAHWHQLVSNGESTAIYLEHANGSITWENLYPEWIDEEEESEVPVCPSLPNPVSPKHSQFNIIAVKLPCNKTSGEWHRDIARFHLQISAAKLASEAESPIHIMFVTECFPIPNLFRGKELVVQQGNVWLYKPDLRVMKEKVQLPIGSCQLSLFLKDAGQTDYESMHRQAYATILHSAHMYVCGAIAAAQSIRMSGSTRDLVILVDETISSDHRGGLEEAGWKVRTIQRIRNPRAERDAYNEWNYSKFRLWQLTDYDKIIFIDADLLILRNIDFLFTMPEISATGNNGTLFNSGVMVIEPSNVTFDLLMDHINEIESYNGGDQGYLNEIFTWWHRIPKHLNFLKHFWEGDEEDIKEMKTQLFGADPPILYVLHYLGTKPWLCFRDYDCNWNVDILQEFASDVAHARWWKVHDAMPEKLQKFCLLRSKQKAGLEWDRRQAEKANYADGHWKEKIHDERLKVCFEKFCYWESMLWHWGDANWTDTNTNTTTTTTTNPSPTHKLV